MNIYYIYHSAFVVEGEKSILVFDYERIPNNKETERAAFFQDFIYQEKKPVYVFASHSHADHYNPEILDWAEKNPKIQYIFSSDISVKAKKGRKIHSLTEGEELKLGELRIRSYGSTDLGLSFLVETEGKSLFHAGDCNHWHWEDDSPEEVLEMRDRYLDILGDLKEDLDFSLDFAFVPVDPRLGEYRLEGVELFAQEIDVLEIIPMHFDEGDYVLAESRELLDPYAIVSPSSMEPMSYVYGVFYQWKEDAQGHYLQVVDAQGDILEYDRLELDAIYPYLSSGQKFVFFAGWGEVGDKTYLEDKEDLLAFLKDSSHLVDADFQKIPCYEDKEGITLYFHEIEGKPGYYQSGLELKTCGEDFDIISENVFYCQGALYYGEKEEKTLYSLRDLITELRQEDLEALMSLAHYHFPKLDFRYKDYKLERALPLLPSPSIRIEKISVDNSLTMHLGADVYSMKWQFLQENHFEEIIYLNEREKKMEVAKINLTKVTALLDEMLKILTKIQREQSLRHGYYLDDDYYLILPESVAREFIRKHLLQFANHYQITGTEQLKKYNIKTVKPRITGSFHYSIDFLEGEAEIDIEGEKFSIQDVLNSYQKDSYIVLSDGTNALINKRYIEKLERIFQEGEDNKVKISFFDLPIIDDMIEEKVLESEYLLQKNFFYGMNDLSKYHVQLPELKATLRSYQEYGYKWLSYLMERKLGACLADDMGLGKTLQAIALLTRVHGEGVSKKTLIIMPKSLIFNWQSEIEKFSPGLTVGVYYGNNRDMAVLEDKEIILTTYGTVRNDIERLQEEEFQLVILDESQNIKNVHSQTTKAVMLLKAENRLALSGTPIENNLSELYSLFRFLNPGMFGSLEDFNTNYAMPIQKENSREAIQDLRKKIYPFILRRVKKEVLKDLPEKIEQVIYMEMNPEHKKYYEERRRYYYNMIHTSIQEKGLGKVQFFVLQALNELRQITSCPETKNPVIASSKKEMLMQQIIEAVENDHKVLVFTNYIGSIDSITASLEAEGIPHLSMTGNTKDRQQLVNKFQKDETYKVFVMTLKTGGVGLNLTAADTIFIYDPWWNKTVENQAIDRAYRLGQDRTVFSYKLILKDSIEEKILQLQELKSKLLDDVISEDNLSNKSFTETEIEFILGEI